MPLHRDFDSKPLFDCPMVAIISTAHPLARKPGGVPVVEPPKGQFVAVTTSPGFRPHRA
jgi:hypothetical protein